MGEKKAMPEAVEITNDVTVKVIVHPLSDDEIDLEELQAHIVAEIDRDALALAITELVEREVEKKPWHHLVDEKKNGQWADYAAWQEWMDEEMDQKCESGCPNTGGPVDCNACQLLRWWETVNELPQKTALYVLMNKEARSDE